MYISQRQAIKSVNLVQSVGLYFSIAGLVQSITVQKLGTTACACVNDIKNILAFHRF